MITRRLWIMCLFCAGFLCLGLCLGISAYYYGAAAAALVILCGLVNAVILRATLRAQIRLGENEVKRGERVRMSVELVQRCPFPALTAAVLVSRGGEVSLIPMPMRPMRAVSMDLTAPAAHVGNELYGVLAVSAEDVFKLFRVTVLPETGVRVLVLPRPFDIEKPTFIISDEGKSALKTSQEDNTSPEDIRSYVPGDALKRVHWKLSARRGELLVRKYETPVPPDTLILADNARPNAEKGTEDERVLRDLVCETCAAVADLQLKDSSPVRVPMYGDAPGEFTADTPDHSILLQEMLARQPFDGEEPFERVLELELRRMRRTGAVIVITTFLRPAVVEGIICMRRMGPSVRLYLVSMKVIEDEVREAVTRLQHHMVEVCYVTPS